MARHFPFWPALVWLWIAAPITVTLGQQQKPSPCETQIGPIEWGLRPMTGEGRLQPYIIISGSSFQAAPDSPYVAVEGGIAVHPHLGEQPPTPAPDDPPKKDVPPAPYLFLWQPSSSDSASEDRSAEHLSATLDLAALSAMDFDLEKKDPHQPGAGRQASFHHGGGIWMSGKGPPWLHPCADSTPAPPPEEPALPEQIFVPTYGAPPQQP